jgi:NTP pyrophosphatase (non-canonical NTP hydrolase)
MLILVGIEEGDGQEDIDWLCHKIVNLRIFDDENGVMNRSVLDCGGDILVVSQFTLHASTKKGNRPSYIRAARNLHPALRAVLPRPRHSLGKTGGHGRIWSRHAGGVAERRPGHHLHGYKKQRIERTIHETCTNMTLQEAQQQVDNWIRTYGVRYFSELTNMAVLTEEVGELARVMARRYGDQSFKPGEKDNVEEELADVLWVLICLANQTGTNLTEAFRRTLEKKTNRDRTRHINNPKLKENGNERQ